MGSPSLSSSSRGPCDATNRRRVHGPSVILISLPTAFSRSQYAQPLIRPEWFFRLCNYLPLVESVPALSLARLGLRAVFLDFSTCFGKIKSRVGLLGLKGSTPHPDAKYFYTVFHSLLL